MDKIVTKKNLNYTVGKIKGLLNEKQNNITSENKLSKDLVSGLGTASIVDTGTSSGNVPVLGTDGKLPSSVVPASAITDTFVASSQSAMLGLSNANIGDVCVRTDINKSFILKATPYSTLSNWQELLTPTDAVTSVNGQTGAVQLPEAGNGTLTIQRNGEQLGTFKANQTTGTTIDIEVPTVGAAASKGVVTTVDTSANLPTSNAVKTFVEGKGYVTSSGSVASATNATKLNNQDASYYLDYSNFENIPKIPDKISELTEDATHRTVTDTEKSTWNNKVSTEDKAYQFAKSEYNKSLNELNIANKSETTSSGVKYSVVDGVVNKSGTSTNGGITLTLETPLTLKKGRTYIFANLGQAQNQEMSLKTSDGTNVATITYYSKSKTYTPTSNVVITKIGYWIPSGAVASNDYLMVVEDSEVPSEFQPYNASKHITNSQAELLENEYNKQLNLISEEVIAISTYGIRFGMIYNLKPNTTYTFKAKSNNIYGSNVVLQDKDKNKIQDIITNWSVDLVTRTLTFTTNSSVNENGSYSLVFSGTYNSTTTATELILVEGNYTFDTMPSYQPYHGEIIRKGDITPVLLWENASPNASFEAQTITISNLSQYTKLKVKYKNETYSYLAPTYKEIDYKKNAYFTFSIYDDGTIFNRNIQMLDSGVKFAEGKSGTTARSSSLIPIAIYGLKY